MSDSLKLLPAEASPILKWAGGKNSLLPQIRPHLPPTFERYFEPFVGGGAVFFSLQPERSFLFDLNAHLIELYCVTRNQVHELIQALRVHYNDKEYFYEVRAQDPALLSPVERAARFIFLNKTCYNGLYRENSKGLFNVPFGKYKNPTICDEKGLLAASAALQHTTLELGDFGRVLDLAQRGDFIYFDPPYAPLSPTSSFTGYTKNGFGEAEQRRLADVYRQLSDRGCRLMLSNSSAPLIYELYEGFNIHPISARRAINSKANRRGAITELLITN